MRHLGTDINYVVLENLYNDLKSKVDFYFDTPVQALEAKDGGFTVVCDNTPAATYEVPDAE